MFSRDLTIAKYDADLFAAMEQEAQRQEEHIELIASENYTSPAVMEAQGSVLTNKYAEGYPGKRITTVVASTSTWSSNWPSIAPSNCSVPTMPTSSRTLAPKPTPPCTWRCCRPATPSWA